MNTAKIFQNGRSQAVRLPKEFQFDTDEVYVNKVGEMLILFPRDKGWEVLAQSLEHFTDDFMERDQPTGNQKRNAL
jgi:antitoxin VapB